MSRIELLQAMIKKIECMNDGVLRVFDGNLVVLNFLYTCCNKGEFGNIIILMLIRCNNF